MAEDDTELIADLRHEVDDARREIDRLQRVAADDATHERAQQALIEELRRQAGLRDTELAAVYQQVAAAEDELADLRAIRDALTPATPPERPGIELGVCFQPAREGVSGDFYLATSGPEQTTVVVVGDVVGKGLDAARDAAFLRTAFLTSARFSHDPCRLLSWTNVAFRERVAEHIRFATVACLSFDPATREVAFALAGHPPPLRLRAGHELEGGRGAPPLGIVAELDPSAETLELDPGDGVLLYTDGLTEAREDGELFGTERVQTIVREHRDRPTAELLDALRGAASDFSGGSLVDDICLVALRAL